jgi:hypothetical protein
MGLDCSLLVIEGSHITKNTASTSIRRHITQGAKASVALYCCVFADDRAANIRRCERLLSRRFQRTVGHSSKTKKS